MSTEYDLIAHRKWALEFLATLNPGKQFDGDVFEDADALVAYVIRGRQQPKVDAAQAIADVLAQRADKPAPFDINTGLAQ